MSSNLKTLIGKLNPTCKKAAEQAIRYCVSRGQYEVEIEHFFLALLDDVRTDFALLVRHYDISPSAMEKGLVDEISMLRTGNSRTPAFSHHLLKLFEHAWLLASLESGTSRIRSGHLLLALLTEPDLSQLARRGSLRFMDFPIDELKHKLRELTSEFPEVLESYGLPSGASANADGETTVKVDSVNSSGIDTPALTQFTSNLTQQAREGKIDPVIGRDQEIRLVIDILMRRRQNNPILTGEAGVGKTAVVEGLAQRIVEGNVPAPLADIELRVLDIGLLQAGASVKGEFESRLRNVIDEVKRSPRPVILFIDEAHTIIGAGGQAGQNDAANLLKPALARGELRTIAATTWSEYKKYFEKDAALARRFQVVKVEEPSEEVACRMLRGVATRMEEHFKVRVTEEAISEAIRLSARYVSGRQLPDKAISVLDTACAKVALAQTALPALIEDARVMEISLNAEIASLEKEEASGSKHMERLEKLRTCREKNRLMLISDEERWGKEKRLAARIQDLRKRLEAERVASNTSSDNGCEIRNGSAHNSSNESRLADLSELALLQKELLQVQGERSLVPVCVDGQAVGEIISGWTGIPLGKMLKNEMQTVLNLKQLLERRVIGQAHALEQIAQRIRTARANIEDPKKPKGVFLFVGPSGVGKTETAHALADILYGGERNLVVINMSEYQEAHSVAGLKGAPPGYVGYGEGGILTEAVRRKPYSVVLLDEVEKAHSDVLELFFQVFDKGVLEDSEGREVDFRNAVVILTSNIATQPIMQACLNKTPGEIPDCEDLTELIKPALYKTFKPAFLGRMKVIPYYPLPDAVLAEVVRLKLDRIKERIEENHKAAFSYSEAIVDAVLMRCTEVDSGARNVDHIINGTVLPEIAESILNHMADGKAIRNVKITVKKDGNLGCGIN